MTRTTIRTAVTVAAAASVFGLVPGSTSAAHRIAARASEFGEPE
ncbi:hypothetical protein ACLMAL_23965 [Nocardia sp. CWNU-33]